MGKIDVASCVITDDDFFGVAYLDADEERAQPEPHRYIHGSWVRPGRLAPVGTSFSYRDGKITLTSTGVERGGLQRS